MTPRPTRKEIELLKAELANAKYLCERREADRNKWEEEYKSERNARIESERHMYIHFENAKEASAAFNRWQSIEKGTPDRNGIATVKIPQDALDTILRLLTTV